MEKNFFTQKNIGILLIVLSVILILLSFTISSLLMPFGLASGIGMLGLMPLMFVSIFKIALAIAGIYFGIRLLNNKPFARNNSYGQTLIIIGAIYFVYQLANVLGGASLQLINAICSGGILVLMGMSLKK